MKSLKIIAFLSASTASSLSFAFTGPAIPVSEPSTFALFAISAAVLFFTTRNKK